MSETCPTTQHNYVQLGVTTDTDLVLYCTKCAHVIDVSERLKSLRISVPKETNGLQRVSTTGTQNSSL